MPIILLVMLIYELSVLYNLPSLIFIMIFGLFLGNLNELKRFKWIEFFRPNELNVEAQKFKGLTLKSLLFVSPRGIITILLFLSIDPAHRILIVNRALIIQVILLTTLIMMVALIIFPKKEKTWER